MELVTASRGGGELFEAGLWLHLGILREKEVKNLLFFLFVLRC